VRENQGRKEAKMLYKNNEVKRMTVKKWTQRLSLKREGELKMKCEFRAVRATD
jgi:hypothetical protein